MEPHQKLAKQIEFMDGDSKWGRGREENDDVDDDEMHTEPDTMCYTLGWSIFSFSLLYNSVSKVHLFFHFILRKLRLGEVGTLPKVKELAVVELRCKSKALGFQRLGY